MILTNCILDNLYISKHLLVYFDVVVLVSLLGRENFKYA